jgi:hypothetical protein
MHLFRPTISRMLIDYRLKYLQCEGKILLPILEQKGVTVSVTRIFVEYKASKHFKTMNSSQETEILTSLSTSNTPAFLLGLHKK